MSFIDDVKSYLADDPEGVMDLPNALGCGVADVEHHDSRRWYDVIHTVFQLKTKVSENPVTFKDEYVLVEHCEPATELQEGGDFPEPEVFAVEPYIVEVVKYRPV
jgi:hypothetical protein